MVDKEKDTDTASKAASESSSDPDPCCHYVSVCAVLCQIRLDGRSYTQILRGLMERGMLEAAWSLLDHIGVRGVQVRLMISYMLASGELIC